ncbi:MAG: hypothetical protein ACRDDJ_23735, partial [[Mycobacterium] stephanolepidis]
MPKQDRGAPARPPWLPEEDEQRGFLRSLRRKKRNADDPESSEDSLTHETGHSPAPQTPAQKPIAESVLPPVEKRAAVAPREETANGTTPVPDVSKYHTPPRAPVPPEPRPLTAAQEPLTTESNEIVPTPVAGEPRIVTSPIPEMRPEPQPISQVEQPQTPPADESPAIPVPEPAAPEAAPDAEAVSPSAIEASADIADSPEPAPVAEPPTAPSSPASTADQRREESAGADPFSRFSLLEAQLRQMSLDESITDAELERHRRHALPESEATPAPEAPGALSFTPPEAVDEAPDVVEDTAEPARVPLDAQSAGPSPAPALGFTLPEAIDEPLSETEEAELTAAVPDVEPEPEPPTALAADSLAEVAEPDVRILEDLVPELPVEEEPTSVSEHSAEPEEPVAEAPESADSPEIDDVDARAAALLQRIEAKRAELDEELAAHDAADSDVSVPEPEPAPFVPMIAPWASVPEVAATESTELSAGAEEAVETETTTPELQGFAPLADEDIVIDLPAAVFEETSADSDIEDVVGLEPELADESKASVEEAPDILPGDEIAGTAIESTDDAPVTAAADSEDAAVESDSNFQTDHGDASSQWEAPSAIPSAPVAEPPMEPAYFVPPPAPQPPVSPQPGPGHQLAAQAPPGWNPRQPYPGQWPQGAPQSPESIGGQQFSQQPPPQPTSVEGQWQWVPQPQAPQPPVPQELPPGYVPPPQGAVPPANYRGPQAYRMPPSLDEAEVINRGRYAPRSGWRKAVHRSTGGRVNPGDSRKDREQDQLLASIRQPILGDYRIAVLSIKGGVGKTTTTLGLGSAFATIRT